MELRKYQQDAKTSVYQAFRDGTQNVLLQLPTGCHLKGTKVLMYDGTLKNVEEIQLGELLMGVDSKPRKVIKLYNGYDDMYKIIPIKGKPFVVNKEHILSLKETNQHQNPKYLSRKGGKINNISVSEYLLKSKHFKHINKLYRVPVEFQNTHKDFIIDPYFLGVLLGDGSLKRGIMITTMDKEVVNEIYKQAEKLNLQIREEIMPENKAKNYHFVVNLNSKKTPSFSNKLKNEINNLGLNVSSESKFVPTIYKLGSKETRYAILAGLLDTDGSLAHNGYEFCSKSYQLASDVVFIAQSLGFMTNLAVKTVNGFDYYRVNINGNTDLIPLNVKHKIALPRKQKKDVLVTGFRIEYYGYDEYFGFELDKDNLYLLDDFTVTHNSGKTVLFGSIVKDGFESKRRTLILAHRSELLKQANEKLFYGYGVISSYIAAGYPMNHHNFSQIGSVQTMINRELRFPIDLCIIDEAHHMQESNTYGKIKDYLLSLNPNCKFLGVTATPCRTNGKGFEKVFDKLIQGVSVSYLIQNNFLTPPKYFISPLDLGKIKVTAGDYNQKELSEVYQDKVHPFELVENWQKLANGLQTIGFAVDIEHSKKIVAEFNKHGIIAAHIDGTTHESIRDRTIKDYKNKKIQVLYNVGIFDEGFDVPEIEAIQLARPTKSLVKYMQMVGRGLRPVKGKEFALVLDHAGLVAEHDIVEREREWSLEGAPKSKSKKKTMFLDKATGKTYEPKQLPLDIPMQRIELVQLDNNDVASVDNPALKQKAVDLLQYAHHNNKKSFWIWYQLAKEVRVKSKAMARHRLYERAKVVCEVIGYSESFAEKITDEYINNYSSLYTKP